MYKLIIIPYGVDAHKGTFTGFKTQDEAYTFFLTYFDDSYNLEIINEDSEEIC